TRRFHRDGAPQYLAVSALWTGVAPRDVDPAFRWAALLQPAARRCREAFECAHMADVDWSVPDGGSGRRLDRPLRLRGSPGGTLGTGGRRPGLLRAQRRGPAHAPD